MNAGWMFLRTELRKRWRSWLALALIVGAFAGAVEAAAAGARRTDAAYPALLTWSRAPDLLAASAVGPSVFGHISQSALAGLPQVAGKALLAEYAVAQPSDVALVAPETGKVPVTFWRRKILAGRLPDPRRADEADISFTLAQARHLRVGDVLQVDALTAGAKPRPVPFTFHIVGIDAAPSEFPPQTGTGTDDLWATPAFYARHNSGLAIFRMAALRLRHGAAEIPPVLHEINRLAHGRPTLTYPLATQSANTERSIHLQAVALWLLAALLAVIGVLVTGQLLARQGFLEADDFGTLRALGMSPRQLLAAGLARAAVIGAGGAVAAGLLAVAVSPLFPVGLARVAEPYPGLRVDGVVVVLGALATVLATVACAVPAAWRSAAGSTARALPPADGVARRRPAVTAVARGIRPVPARLGIGLAVQPGAGRTAVPVRSTIASAAVGVAALTAAIVFSASLGHLLATPRLYGVSWDADVQGVNNTGIAPAIGTVARDPQVAAWTTCRRRRSVAGQRRARGGDGDQSRPRSLLLAHPDAGPPAPGAGRDHAGRAHSGRDPLACGCDRNGDARRLPPGQAQGGRGRRFPDAQRRARARVRGHADARRPAPVPASRCAPPAVGQPAGPVPAAGRRPGGGRRARRPVTPHGPFSVSGPAIPTDLVNFGRVQDLPLLLGVALGLLALGTIVHLLLTAVRRRRRDFAVLRVVGLTRGQVRATVGWQAATLASAALVIGVPAGVLVGRTAWRIFAHQLGILPVVAIPPLTLAAVAAVALAVAVAAAAVPGESAARSAPATILRSE